MIGSFVSVLIPLTALIYLAYRGVSVLILGPTLAFVAVVLAGGVPILATYTQIFMPAAGGFVTLYFPLFLLGAIFGKLMDTSGAAMVIAKTIIGGLGESRAILAVVLASAILTYGGVSLFVVAFATYPIAAALFKEANIPKRLIPASIALGAFTFTMTALPGTPSIQNAIPMPYFGTTAFASPGIGIIASLIMLLCGQWWLKRQMHSAIKNMEGYGDDSKDQENAVEDSSISPSKEIPSVGIGSYNGDHTVSSSAEGSLQSYTKYQILLAILPIVIVVGLNYGFSTYMALVLDTHYLAEDKFGNTDLESVKGLWSIISALTLGCLCVIGCHIKRMVEITHALSAGAEDSVLPIFNTASLVGFGAVIATLPAFTIIQQGIQNLGDNPLVSLAFSMNVLAGITGSASGGMSIVLQSLGDTYLKMAEANGIAPALLHRISTIATGGLDSLPHNGAVVTLLGICGLTHQQAYKDIFFVAVLFPICALIMVIVLGSYFGSF